MGHPDKLADRISDSVLDALLAQDPKSRVACETVVTTGLALIVGEITTKAIVNYADVVRDAIVAVGYTDDEWGINGRTCNVMVALDRQSPDIAMGVNDDANKGKDIGAGDQGLMFGYACKIRRAKYRSSTKGTSLWASTTWLSPPNTPLRLPMHKSRTS